MNSSHTTRTAVPSRRISTRDLAFAGMIAAILAIISQISVPMPTGVPITIQVFGITLIGVAFGWRLGLYGSLVYILLGAVGLPIFANFRGGFSVLVDLTGGYIWSWPVMAVRSCCLSACGGMPANMVPRTGSILPGCWTICALR